MIQNRYKHDRMANAIRFLSIDAVEKASSGHPGLPMGVADVISVLFSRFLRFDPKAPYWPDRDRFILSAGHGSMLLYALLYLTGYEAMTIEEISQFRQLGSKTPGHPEYGLTPGVETTTGPLAQGLGNSVGFALAERIMNSAFGDDLVNHRTWVLAGDGCLMEGLSQEAISLAGHLKLHKLIVIWDNNGVSIDGPVCLADSTDQHQRFSACGWRVLSCDGHDPDSIGQALEEACVSDRPVLIDARTVIGFGSPSKAGTSKAHGAPMGKDEIVSIRQVFDWDYPPFHIPPDVLDSWRLAGLSASRARQDWEKHFSAAPLLVRNEFERRLSGKLSLEFEESILEYKKKLLLQKPFVATRKASEMVLEVINDLVPEIIGGSADLTASNNTKTSGMKPIHSGNYGNRYIHYGIREHGMVAAMNGLSLHGGIIPYGGLFLCFSDYARPSIRLACLMGICCIFVMTHDSIGLGEDGPTHQPVEHLASLRALPHHLVFRPADAIEVAECWQIALESRKAPSTIVLTRQNLPFLRMDAHEDNLSQRGAYEIMSSPVVSNAVIFASGSEVQIALHARDLLQKSGCFARVVSVPCFELFDAQDLSYQKSIIGNEPVKIAVEAGIRQGWDRFIGSDGLFVGMSDFGASGRAEDLYKSFGITAEKVTEAVLSRLST